MLVMNGLIRAIGSGERQFGGVGSIQSLSTNECCNHVVGVDTQDMITHCRGYYRYHPALHYRHGKYN